MGSSFNYNVDSAFKAIDKWQSVIVRNAQGLLESGYNRTAITFGQNPGSQVSGSQVGTNGFGGRNSITGGGDSLNITGTHLIFEQGSIEPSFSPTSLAIRGEGFFVVAENLRPGARLFLTRAGDFHYDGDGNLVSPQGLFVMGANGTLKVDAQGRLETQPIPVKDPGDGTVNLPEVSLAKVGVRSQLTTTGFGATVYQTNDGSGPMQIFANGRAEVGFIQASSIEQPSRVGAAALLQVDTQKATQTYKIFKDMLDNFNKTTDDAISVVK
ncbi:MAG: flagellar hook-basal body protein [Cyanobacteria bacterium RYN_339]|nr:flagellar hook-basal body protein [Cyanobacteria bacterium RYN_339]